MFGLHGFITIHLVCSALVLASSDDREILVTDRTEGDLAGYIQEINMTSRLIRTLQGFKIIRPVAIDYDSLTDRIYWSDVVSKEIRTSRRGGGDEQTFLHLNTKSIADGITIDSHIDDRLLFYTDTGNDVIVSVSLDAPFNRTVIVSSDLEKPRGITAYHEKKQIIWTDWSGWASIKLCSYTGTGRRTLVNTDIQWPNGITLDRKNEMIYWCDAGKDRIESIKLDGSQRRTVLVEPNTHYFGIFFFEDALFLTDWKSKSVRELSLNGTEIDRITATRFNKLTGIIVLRVSRCRHGTYGDDCTAICGHCAEGASCDKVTGLCLDGCQQGYHGNCTHALCRERLAASVCDKTCECELCRDETGSCPRGCQGAWYKSACESTTVEITRTTSLPTREEGTTSANSADGSEVSRASDSAVDGSEASTDSSGYETSSKVPEELPQIGGVTSEKSKISLAIPVLGCVVFLLLIVLGLTLKYVQKLRRDVINLKTYDHLQGRRSVSTVVTRCSHDYSGMEEEVDALPESKLCPDILLRDPPHTIEEEENVTSLDMFIDEEPRYISVGSLNA